MTGMSIEPNFTLIVYNQVANHITKKGKHRVQMLPDILELIILLLAGNAALSSTILIDLQNQLNYLKKCCDSLALTVSSSFQRWWIFSKAREMVF